jgi:trypsin
VFVLLALLVVAAPAGAIYGGRYASAGEQSWAAAVELSGEPGVVCSGDVIAPTKVLTAAHCAAGTPAADLVVVTGAADVRDPRAQRSGVTGVAIHPDYGRVDSSYDDFAVLTLARPTSAPAVRLAGPDDHRVWVPGAPLTIAGWGVTMFHGNDFPNRLRVAGINALAYGRCYDQFDPDFSSDLMVCGAGARSGRGTAQACQGDSGGPVTGLDAAGAPVLVAVTSFGNDCGDPLNVYSKIDAVAGWIAAAAGIGAPADALTPPRPQIAATRIAGARIRVSAANLPAGAAMRVYAIARIGGDTFPVRTLTSRIPAAVIGAGMGVGAIGVVFVQRYAYGPLAYLTTNAIR